jgi:D-alanine-D-alanine ligase
MPRVLPEFPQVETIILVADIKADQEPGPAMEYHRDLEKSSPATVEAISQTIRELGLDVLHLQSLDELTDRAKQHLSSDLVLSIYGGERSRNRMALVPAICESFGLRFVGPDVYGRIVCQDKEISKRLAKQCGVLTPRYQIVRNQDSLLKLNPKQFPLVVKPNFEGSSIGISKRSLVKNIDELIENVTEVLIKFDQPVLIEEFIPGREVCYNLIEGRPSTDSQFAEIRIADHPRYFDHNFFCAEEKAAWMNIDILSINDELLPEDKHALNMLVASLGRYGYCRIDGKLVDGRFHFIELTPDAWLDPSGAFSLSFTKSGWTYGEVLASLLASESANHPCR